jgi:poly-beta-hydroxybutyrate-responsive repressor
MLCVFLLLTFVDRCNIHISALQVKPLEASFEENFMASSTDSAPNGTGRSREPRLHGELLATSLLSLLREWNAHGYELGKRLGEMGLPPFDSGTIYRTLRNLEQDGLISSLWDMSASGPARRRYSITKAGETFLTGWIDVLQRYQGLLQSASETQRQKLERQGQKPSE